MASFVFGMVLAELDELIYRVLSSIQFVLGVVGVRRALLRAVAGVGYSLSDCSRRPADAALRLHDSGAAGKNPLSMRFGLFARWSLSASPATAFTCCTSTSGI